MGGTVLDRLLPEAEREYLCAENVWFRASLLFCLGIATPSHAQSVKPAPPIPIDVKNV
jgi:hypothetical protein